MMKREAAAAAIRTAWHHLPFVVLVTAGALLVFCAATLLARHFQKQNGLGAVSSPVAPTVAYGETSDAAAARGRFTANIDYTSLAAPDDGKVTSRVAWDDSWFFQDSSAYNHELATTASVIAALAYSESGYYQASNTQPAYMENALAKLGFQDVSTESYRYRSEVVDEVLNLFTDDSDTVAYAIARKHLDTGDAAPRDLIVVSIRGSYGSEWLSNLNLMPREDTVAPEETSSEAAETAGSRVDVANAVRPLTDILTSWLSFVESLTGQVSDADDSTVQQLDGTDDHSGYVRAAAEICAELDRWIGESRDSGAEVSVLLAGHSRGGAIANLVASELDDALVADGTAEQAEERAAFANFSQVSDVYAYTFASPATTVSADAHADRYGNIFNIVNPSDIMPYLPLRAWGYERYGVNLYLPAVGEEGFAAGYEDMRRSYAQTVGAESSYDPADKHVIDRVVGEVSQQVETAKDLMTPAGVAATVAACATHINPVRILYGHYPSTYIAWMDVLDAGDLACE